MGTAVGVFGKRSYNAKKVPFLLQDNYFTSKEWYLPYRHYMQGFMACTLPNLYLSFLSPKTPLRSPFLGSAIHTIHVTENVIQCFQGQIFHGINHTISWSACYNSIIIIAIPHTALSTLDKGIHLIIFTHSLPNSNQSAFILHTSHAKS